MVCLDSLLPVGHFLILQRQCRAHFRTGLTVFVVGGEVPDGRAPVC